MRPIKLQAWDKKNNEWFTDVLEVNLDLDWCRLYENGKWIELNNAEINEKFEFVQYTGL